MKTNILTLLVLYIFSAYSLQAQVLKPKLVKTFVGLEDEKGNMVVPAQYDDIISISDKLFKIVLEGKYGLMDNTGKIVLPMEHNEIGEFSEGIAILRKSDNNYTLINEKGKIITDSIYQHIYPFKNGYAIVLDKNKYNFIDKTGKEIFKKEYKNLHDFYNGLARVSYQDKYYNINLKEELIELIYDYHSDNDLYGQNSETHNLYCIKKENKYGLKNKKRKIIIPPIYKKPIIILNNGLAIGILADTVYTLLNPKDKSFIPKNYKFISYNRFLYLDNVQNLFAITKNGSVLIDSTGKEIKEYPNAKVLADRIITISKNGKIGLLNEDGEEISPIKYTPSNISMNTLPTNFYRNSKFVFWKINNKFGILNSKTGKELTSFDYDTIGGDNHLINLVRNDSLFFISEDGNKIVYNNYESTISNDNTAYIFMPNNLIRVKQNNKYGMINTNLTKTIPPIYKNMAYFSPNIVAVMNDENKWGLVDINNNIIIPFLYDEIKYNIFKHSIIKYFHNGVVRVKKNRKYGLMDRNGNEKVNCEYDAIDFLDNNDFLVLKNNKFGVIDIKGNILIPIEYNNIHINTEKKHYTASVNNHSFIIDYKGNILSNKKYIEIYSLYNSYIAINIDYKYTLLNECLEPLNSFKYSKIESLNENLYKVFLNEKMGLIDSKGKEIFPVEYEWIENIDNFIIVTNKDSKRELYDLKFKKILPEKYFYTRFEKNNCMLLNEKSEFLLFDYKEKKIILPLSKFISKVSDEVYIYQKMDNKTILYDIKKKKEISKKYDAIISTGNTMDYLVVINNQLLGIISKNGKEIIPPIYDECSTMNERYIKVKKDNKIGILDYKGKEILPIEYDDIIECVGINKFVVQLKDKYGVITADNKIGIPLEYDNIEPNYYNNMIKIKKDNLWGYTDTLFNIIVSPKYNSIIHKYNNKIVIAYLGRSSILIDSTGKEIISDPSFNAISFDDPYFKLYKQNENELKTECLLDDNGKVLIPCEYTSILRNGNYCIVGKNNYKGLIDIHNVSSG